MEFFQHFCVLHHLLLEYNGMDLPWESSLKACYFDDINVEHHNHNEIPYCIHELCRDCADLDQFDLSTKGTTNLCTFEHYNSGY